MLWVWLAGLSFFATGIVGVWYAVTRTDYLPRLAVWMIKQALPIIMKRKSPEQEKLWREAMKRGQEWDMLRNRPKDTR
jgi:uncharacterized membrane protein